MKWIFSVLALSLASASSAETLRVVVTELAQEMAAAQVQAAVQALTDEGLDVQLEVLPARRALAEARSGTAVLDLFRFKRAMAEYPELVAIEPQIPLQQPRLAVRVDNRGYCDLRPDQLNELRLAAISGAQIIDAYIAPHFKEAFYVSHLEQAIKMVQSNRIDATLVPLNFIETAPAEQIAAMHFCEQPTFTIRAHSYLHVDYLALKPVIESAYSSAFGSADKD